MDWSKGYTSTWYAVILDPVTWRETERIEIIGGTIKCTQTGLRASADIDIKRALSGIEQWSCAQTSVPGMGFNGIAAAFLGGLNPVGAVFSSYFIQHITSGGSYADKTLYCSQISDLISAIIIYLCAFVLFFKICLNSYLRRRAEKAQAGKGGNA